jgi:hypothetical protein
MALDFHASIVSFHLHPCAVAMCGIHAGCAAYNNRILLAEQHYTEIWRENLEVPGFSREIYTYKGYMNIYVYVLALGTYIEYNNAHAITGTYALRCPLIQ